LSSVLYVLGAWVVRARRWVIAAWCVLIVLIAASALMFSSGLDSQIVIPGLEASDALESLGRTFPQASGSSAQILVVAPDGAVVGGPAYTAPIDQAIATVEKISQVTYVISPFSEGVTGAMSDDHRAALITVQVSFAPDGYATDATKAALQEATDWLQGALPAGAQASLGGGIFSYTLPTITLTEVFGVVAALIVLVLNFGSLLVAGMPIMVALAGVGVAMSLIYLGTAFTSINSTTPILSLMLGLAVGIDYSLFIISRHRQQVRRGLPPAESIPRALATSGSAVVFAGLTVIVALLGLAVARIPFLTTMGMAAAVAVGLAVLAALTLLPAVLTTVGDRVLPRAERRQAATVEISAGPPALGEAQGPADSSAAAVHRLPTERPSRPVPSVPPKAAPSGEAVAQARILLGLASVTAQAVTPGDGPAPAWTQVSAGPRSPAEPIPDAVVSDAPVPLPAGEAVQPAQTSPAPARRNLLAAFFSLWVRAATRFPPITIALVVVVLGAAAIPAVDLRLALPDAGWRARDDQARITYDRISEHFGEGYNATLVVTGLIVTSTDPLGLMAAMADEISHLDGVKIVAMSTPNPSADTGIIQIIPTTGPSDAATQDLVWRLRALRGHFLEEYDVEIAVTGLTAVMIDVSGRLSDAMVPFGVVVVTLSLVLLTLVFRSLWVPVKATLGYLLSVAAAFGAVAVVFQRGFGDDLLNVPRQGPVIAFMPIVVMGVLFGLAMDYELFLVSRMREEYLRLGRANPAGAARRAVQTGFLGSARVVAAAAVIMFAVFVAFVPESDLTIKPMALGLAVGVFADAFLVRMTLVPAVMTLLGDRAWHLPAWLAERLPSVDIEGEGLAREIGLRDWPEPSTHAVVAARDVPVPTRTPGQSWLWSARIDPGQVHVIVTPDRVAGTSTLLLATGRLRVDDGWLKTVGYVLPDRAGQVRRRTTYVDLAVADDPLADLIRAMGERPDLLAVDGLAAVADVDAYLGLKALLAARPPTMTLLLTAPVSAVVEPIITPDSLSHLAVPKEVSA
jgi:RND superfamily putative drug exporter